MQSEKIDLLTAALVKVQASLKPAFKNRINPHYKSKYADLDSIWASCRELLASNNLAIIQTTDFLVGQAVLKTLLCHNSGQWVSGDYPLSPDKLGPQGFGTAVKYARRYALEGIIGIVSNDDPEDNDNEETNKEKDTAPPKVQAPHYSNKDAIAASPMAKPIAGVQVQNDTVEIGNEAPWPEGTMVSGNLHVGEYVVPFGKKHKGKTLNEMGSQEVRSYLSWLQGDAEKKGEPLKGSAAEFADAAEAYLAVNESEVPF